MLLNNEYIGLALEGNYLRMAHVKKQGNTLQLLKLDRFELAEQIASSASEAAAAGESFKPDTGGNGTETEAAPGDVFGFDDTEQQQGGGDNSDEVTFEDLEAQAEEREPDLESLDMVTESEREVSSNPILLYNIITEIDTKSVQLGLNIPAGETIFQFIRDTDFREVKAKDLTEDLESKLESIYGQPKSDDNYAYEIRDDGSLVLASIEQQSPLLEVANETRDIYSGKLDIQSVYPDEVALVGLLRSHYQLKASQVTALIQFGPNRCRIVFLEGDQILQVMPVISHGTRSSNVLNVVFSKLLFQLDTGKIPGIDQIVIANNTLGEESVAFFRQNFPDITVQEFGFNEEKFDAGSYEDATVSAFTTAIAHAWAASGVDEEALPALPFLPSYVRERQKIFKLRWHGMLLLFLIFLSIPAFNYFYQQNAERIESLSSDLAQTNARINQLQPVVDQTNEIAQNLTLLTTKLSLLDSLSAGSQTWSTRLDVLNSGMRGIPNTWFTSMSSTDNGTFIEGYTMYRNRIPAVVDLFEEGTLLNVSTEEIREEEIYRFSMIVQEFIGDTTRYSPEKPESIQQILNN